MVRFAIHTTEILTAALLTTSNEDLLTKRSTNTAYQRSKFPSTVFQFWTTALLLKVAGNLTITRSGLSRWILKAVFTRDMNIRMVTSMRGDHAPATQARELYGYGVRRNSPMESSIRVAFDREQDVARSSLFWHRASHIGISTILLAWSGVYHWIIC